MTHHGLAPLKDVQILSIGEEKVILDALLSGRIHGAMLSPPWPFEAEKHGFKIILKASDVVQFPFAGICTYTDKIKNNREQIKKVIRAELDALRFIRERRQENIDMISSCSRWTEKSRRSPMTSHRYSSAATRVFSPRQRAA